MVAQLRRRKQLSEQRKHRKRSAKQKLEIVLAELRGARSVAEVCRAAEISSITYPSTTPRIGSRSCSKGELATNLGARSVHGLLSVERPSRRKA